MLGVDRLLRIPEFGYFDEDVRWGASPNRPPLEIT